MGSVLAFGGLGSVAFGLIALPDRDAHDVSLIAYFAVGLLLLIAFVWHEGRARSPMMPLGLFLSRSFSGINVMTLLLYGALSGAFFLLPFDLIQVHGYSATLAGAVFLPFTVIMGMLSRWSGGLLDRIGGCAPRHRHFEMRSEPGDGQPGVVRSRNRHSSRAGALLRRVSLCSRPWTANLRASGSL
jgi:hypothetical protein